MPIIKMLTGPPAPRIAQVIRCCMMPPPAMRANPASAPMANAMASDAEGKRGRLLPCTPFGRLGFQSGSKKDRLYRPSSCEVPVNSFEA